MITDVTTTLSVSDNSIPPPILVKWLTSLPETATITFIISKGYDDRMSYAPDRVSGIKATWKQEF